MMTDYAVTTGAIALSASATKSLWLLAAGANDVAITEIDVSMDGSATSTAVKFDLFIVTLNANNPSGGAAGTATTPSKLTPGVSPPATTSALTNLTTEPATAFTVASVTTNNTANNSTTMFSSNDFAVAGVTAGQAMSGTGIGASAAVGAALGKGLIATVASTAAGTVTVTFTPVLTVVQSWYVQPLGGGILQQLPLGREYTMLSNTGPPNSMGLRWGLRAVTPAGVTPNVISNVLIEE